MSKPKLSLQEQLLQSGLVSAAQAKSIKSDKLKQTRQQRSNNTTAVDEAKALALKAQTEKAEKDRELNQLRKQQEEQKQLAAQVKQLIELNRHGQSEDGLPYKFIDRKKVKTVYVTDTLRDQIAAGRMAIVKLERRYEIVSAEVADKIKARDSASVIVFNDNIPAVEIKDDPYADFQVPDDLIW
jgi:uncharacterized protein